MTLIKLENNHFIIVENNNKYYKWFIPEGYFYLDDTNTIRQSITNDIDYWNSRKDYQIITHSSKRLEDKFSSAVCTNYKFIDVAEIAELIGVIDVDKLASDLGKDLYIGGNYDFEHGVKVGYQTCIAHKIEKQYSISDLRKAFEDSCKYSTFDEFIKSLEKTEWEVYFDNGKLKLA